MAGVIQAEVSTLDRADRRYPDSNQQSARELRIAPVSRFAAVPAAWAGGTIRPVEVPCGRSGVRADYGRESETDSRPSLKGNQR